MLNVKCVLNVFKCVLNVNMSPTQGNPRLRPPLHFPLLQTQPLVGSVQNHRLPCSLQSPLETWCFGTRSILLTSPKGDSVNDKIPNNEYLGQEMLLKYPTVDALVDLIKKKGKGCAPMKCDLRRAYKQIHVDFFPSKNDSLIPFFKTSLFLVQMYF